MNTGATYSKLAIKVAPAKPEEKKAMGEFHEFVGSIWGEYLENLQKILKLF